ncbi:MAG TPA: DUF1697 domain-containing protein [Vitreimonas sp.]|uniref:DUF1697 domain-containing protein n=1 Tax=Vitreimonas sp. TaxID=3069702 RepID=UPI002D50EABD|nr:DUF1697 domain-containing protein [Vitreimonas sp.]HYD89494.1 DUF1697 domain-containing protein [Vitreimonas sp.]
MPRQVALLRGVNLGKRKVVMSELRAVIEAGGYSDVRTLIASGNLVLDAKQKGPKLEAALEKLILDGLGLKTDVFVRTADELDAIIAADPFKAFTKTTPSFMVVNFMREAASAAEMEAMKTSSLTGEDVKQGERCLYIKFPSGQGPSKLKLPKLGTARNWNTVLKLAAAARGE